MNEACQSSTPTREHRAELAAVMVAATAALADFKREDAAFISDRERMPDYILWSVRLAAELDHVLRLVAASIPIGDES